MSTKKRKTYPWYALRRTLPLWSFEENLAELVEFLPKYKVDEVIIKVDTEDFTHGQPPLDWIKRYQKKLFQIKKAMKKISVVYSINPWITIGHCDRGRDSRSYLPGLRTIVGHDGTKCTCCACPLCKVWRANTAKVWRLYAETEPAVIWVEDDIRTFYHSPADFGCFCSEHIRLFSKRVGKKVSREELVKAIIKPGRPHRWRKQWLDMQAEVMIDTVGFLARTVHKVSPETSMGLMSSGPRRHCIEGRRWREFAQTLADGQVLYSRPPMGNYRELSLRGFYYSHDSIKLTRKSLPEGVIEQTEVENFTYTRYANSIASTFIETAISFAYGSDGVTLNLYDHAGTPMEAEAEFGRMLGESKSFFNGLASKAQKNGHYLGVQLLHHEKASYCKELKKNAGYRDMEADGALVMEVLETHGIATGYKDSSVIASCGQILRAFSDDQIKQMLSKGMYLDIVAAGILFERGFGELIGLKSIDKPRCIDDFDEVFSAEEFYNKDFGGADKKLITLTIPGNPPRPSLSVVELAAGAKVISRAVDADAKRHHICMYAYQNKLGGRIAVYTMALDTAFLPVGCAFNNTFRAQQLQGIIRWLSKGKVSLIVKGGVYPLGLRKDCEGFTLLGLFNLTLDEWPYVEFEFADDRKIAKMQVLKPTGRWTADKNLSASSKDGVVRIKYQRAVRYDKPLFVTVDWQ